MLLFYLINEYLWFSKGEVSCVKDDLHIEFFFKLSHCCGLETVILNSIFMLTGSPRWNFYIKTKISNSIFYAHRISQIVFLHKKKKISNSIFMPT